MSEIKTQGTVDQAIESVVSTAHCLLNKCQDFAVKTFPSCLEYFEKVKAIILPLFTFYLLPLLERMYNFATCCVNGMMNFAYNYYLFVKSIISYPFTIVAHLYAYCIGKMTQVKECAQEGVCQAKVGYDRIKHGNFSLLVIWRNTLDMVIDGLNRLVKNSDDTVFAKIITDWNVIDYLQSAKFALGNTKNP